MYNKTTSKPNLIPLQDALGVIKQSGTIKVFCVTDGCNNPRTGEHSSWGIRIYNGMIDESELQCKNCGARIEPNWTGD